MGVSLNPGLLPYSSERSQAALKRRFFIFYLKP
jgi:hypothetical protein